MKQIKKIENLVIGGNLEALECAFKNGYYIFYPKLETPFHLEQTKEGIAKKNILENYSFLLSCSGLNLYTPYVSEFRIKKNSLILTGKTSWQIEYQATNLLDMRKQESKKTLYKVVDYINVRSCGSHDTREIKTDDNFGKEIYFYPSKRNNSSKNFSLSTHNYETITKDAIVVSYLTKKQIEDEDYSPIYSRLRLKEVMKEVGIKGKRCGTRLNGSIKRNAIKLEFDKREILEIETHERNYYYTSSKNGYVDRLYKYLYGKNSKTAKN